MIYILLFILIVAVLFLGPGLLPERHWTRYYLFYTAYTSLAGLMPFLMLPILLISPRIYSKLNVKICSSSLGHAGIKWDIRNIHNYKKCSEGVLVLNHQSILDCVGFLFLNNGYENLSVVGKKQLWFFPPLAVYMKMLGWVLIDRKKPIEAMEKIMARMENAKGTKFLIFPEGTRNQKGNGLLPFKRGAFRLAIHLQQPIIPAVFSPYVFLKPEKNLFLRGTEIISCLEPIPTKGLQDGDVDSLMEKTRKLMEVEYFKLSKELGKIPKTEIKLEDDS